MKVRLGHHAFQAAVFAHTLCIALLFFTAHASAQSSGTMQPTGNATADTAPFTFSRLIVREPGELETAELSGIRIQILSYLRREGYNVVGAENPLFDMEKSHEARMILGGSITHFKCSANPLHGNRVCDLTVVWELFNVRTENVVYQVTTQGRGALYPREKFASKHLSELILRNLRSLLKKPGFNATLRNDRETETAGNAAPPKGSIKACTRKKAALPDEMSSLIDATVLLRPTEGSIGSGFFISDDSLILTAAHVVDTQQTVRVETKAGFTLTATVLRRNREGDAALLKVEGQNLPCLPIATSTPQEGSDVYAVGTPLDEKLRFSVSKGIVSGTPTVETKRFIQTDMALNPGNSGGPLVDSSGQVAGLVSKKDFRGEGISFAVPLSDALESLSLVLGDSTDAVVLNAAAPRTPTISRNAEGTDGIGQRAV